MRDRYERCPNCMNVIGEENEVCPNCGFDFKHYEEKPNCLKPFTVLQGKYMLGRVIGVGGFGITYIGWDLNLQTYIAIKEYFPDSIASRDTTIDKTATQVSPHESESEVYQKGLKRYVEEAQNLSKFYNLQGIVYVKDFFYENGTGYIVMEYINGINLKEFLKNSGGTLDEATVLALMKPVLESLYQIHNYGLVHRDISPDNIMVDSNGKIKLIDFGSARGESAETDKTYTVILKHGYAPPEQYYAKGNQGPWTDIYSLCATMYKMLTGQVPPNSIERMENDSYVAPSAWGKMVSPRTEAVIARGLALKTGDRYKNIGDMLKDLYGERPLDANRTSSVIANGMSYNSDISSQSLSKQSMRLDVPQQNTSKKNNKKTAAIASVVVCAAVLLVVIIFAFNGGSKNKKEDMEAEQTSEVDKTDTELPDNTGEPQSTEDLVLPPDVPIYIWPTELSDNWKDYTANLSGTLYSFPIPYTEFVSKGWKTDNVPTHIASGALDYIDFYDGKLTLRVCIANYTANDTTLDNCLIIGFDTEFISGSISKDAVLEIAGGIKLYETDKASAKAVLGVPDYVYTSELLGYDEIAYYNKDTTMGLDLRFDGETGKLSSISMANTEVPEGVMGSVADIDSEPPEINSLYKAPSGPSSDKLDNIITVDDLNIMLPCPVSVLLDAGWELDDETDEYISANQFENSIRAKLEKSGNRIEIGIENVTTNSILPKNGLITEIYVDGKYCDIPVIFPGGIKVGGDSARINELYADADYYTEEVYDSFISYYVSAYSEDSVSKSVRISAYADQENKKITSYDYTEYGYKLE